MTQTQHATDVSVQSLYEELRDRVQLEGAATLAEYLSLVDELIEEKEVNGQFGSDENLEQIRDDLEQMWLQLEEEL
jgi:hypothetical protein